MTDSYDRRCSLCGSKDFDLCVECAEMTLNGLLINRPFWRLSREEIEKALNMEEHKKAAKEVA